MCKILLKSISSLIWIFLAKNGNCLPRWCTGFHDGPVLTHEDTGGRFLIGCFRAVSFNRARHNSAPISSVIHIL